MRTTLAFLLTLAAFATFCPAEPPQRPAVPLFEGLGTYGRKVATSKPDAQKYFDQGLMFMFAFNHDEAVRAFRRAAEIDSDCAMAYWGTALASGVNYNNPMFPPEKAKQAFDAVQKAHDKSKGESDANKALIEALSRRYADPLPKEPKTLETAYSAAMKVAWEKFPNDADIGSLYAESLMNLRPWELWTADGKPAPETPEIVRTLEAVRKLDPNHPLANHLYIHALEAGPEPGKADDAANRLRKKHPALGHLLHMPSHIDLRRGRWQEAVEANQLAIAADGAYQQVVPEQGFYRLYMAHNYHMLTFAAMMQGQSELALKTIRQMGAGVPREWLAVKENAAIVDGYLAMPLEVLKRFGRWDDILKEPEPPEVFPMARALRHYTRGVAYAAKGQVVEARAEQKAFKDGAAKVAQDARFGNNTAGDLFGIATDMLEGEILLRDGKTKDGLEALKAAVAKEDKLRYSEPPDWFVPTRHALGAFLLKDKQAAAAEAVYREDLRRWPDNGWSLHGLASSLEAQGKKEEAARVKARFTKVWERADVKIPSSCYCVTAVTKSDARETLWATVRAGDEKAITSVLDKGADINIKNEYGITALWIAANKGKAEVVALLLARGADPNARDGIWYQTPLSQSLTKLETTNLLLKAGAKDVDSAAITAASKGTSTILQAILDTGKVSQAALDAALFRTGEGNKVIREALIKAGAKPLPDIPRTDREAWKPLAGTYENEYGTVMKVEIRDIGLVTAVGTSIVPYKASGANSFSLLGGEESSLVFERKGDKVARVVSKRYTAETVYFPLGSKPVAKVIRPPKDIGRSKLIEPTNWPQFRGVDASGVADGQDPPLTWDMKSGTNVLWKTPIPGLGHSCPVIWGDRMFLTTAVGGNTDLRTGNYGDPSSVKDESKLSFQVICLDRLTGTILWTRMAFEGVPKIKRHLKGSHANCTIATDGKRLVACFGSEGMYCYDLDGKLLWKRDLGTLDSSFALEQQYEWGFAASPVLFEECVILQCDMSKDSFIAAYSLTDGSQLWTTPRDEIPSWSSPVLWRNAKRVEIVTNASQYARGYDPVTGKELWRLEKKSEATVLTPAVTRDLAFVVSGNRPIQPLFAIKPGAIGDISLKPGELENSSVAWGKLRGGPYMPTPIVYGKYLYTIGNSGMVTCYDAATGKEIYKERVGGTSYTASPVAADGRLYFVSEQGEVRVVKAGPDFELLAVNPVGEVCMATPAISGGALFLRTKDRLIAFGRK